MPILRKMNLTNVHFWTYLEPKTETRQGKVVNKSKRDVNCISYTVARKLLLKNCKVVAFLKGNYFFCYF